MRGGCQGQESGTLHRKLNFEGLWAELGFLWGVWESRSGLWSCHSVWEIVGAIRSQ